MDTAPGTIIGNKYLLDRKLVRLGERAACDRGSVWVARDEQLGSLVALKLFHPGQASSAAFHARMERELRAVAELTTRHVVRTHDHGVVDGVPFLVMDLLFGEDLATRLLLRSRLSILEAQRLGVQTGEALRCAHAGGLLHQNLRPESVFLALEGDEEIVKVLDFGLARGASPLLLAEAASDVNPSALCYLSPEQLRADRDIDARTDLWSLAVLLYRAITGELPFSGELPSVIASKILLAPVPSAVRLVPWLPAALDGFFEKAFARDRARRFRSVDELLEAFAPIVDAAPPPSSLSEFETRPRAASWALPVERMRARGKSGAPGRTTAERVASVAPRLLEIDRSGADTLLSAASPDLSNPAAIPVWGRWLFPAGAAVLGTAVFLTAGRLPQEAPPDLAVISSASQSVVTAERPAPLLGRPTLRPASPSAQPIGSAAQVHRAEVSPGRARAPAASARPLSSRTGVLAPPKRWAAQ